MLSNISYPIDTTQQVNGYESTAFENGNGG
jgi:hypothetical protein